MRPFINKSYCAQFHEVQLNVNCGVIADSNSDSVNESLLGVPSRPLCLLEPQVQLHLNAACVNKHVI